MRVSRAQGIVLDRGCELLGLVPRYERHRNGAVVSRERVICEVNSVRRMAAPVVDTKAARATIAPDPILPKLIEFELRRESCASHFCRSSLFFSPPVLPPHRLRHPIWSAKSTLTRSSQG